MGQEDDSAGKSTSLESLHPPTPLHMAAWGAGGPVVSGCRPLSRLHLLGTDWAGLLLTHEPSKEFFNRDQKHQERE